MQVKSRPGVVVCLKSFGDLIIARSALRDFHLTGGAVTLIIGDHLTELNAALGVRTPSITLHHSEGGVPALYDIRKRGITRALQSAWRLRRLMAEAVLSNGGSFLFDHIGLRERFIAVGRPTHALPPADNVYSAYSIALRGYWPESAAEPEPSQMGQTVGIFAGSRIQRKVLPVSVIDRLLKACKAAGLKSIIYVLEGEPIQLPSNGQSVVVIARSFDAMARAVREADAVLSADSMPAHLAEYYRRPVFVVSPVANQYWLPISAFRYQRWSLFEHTSVCEENLYKFLGSLSPK